MTGFLGLAASFGFTEESLDFEEDARPLGGDDALMTGVNADDGRRALADNVERGSGWSIDLRDTLGPSEWT